MKSDAQSLKSTSVRTEPTLPQTHIFCTAGLEFHLSVHEIFGLCLLSLSVLTEYIAVICDLFAERNLCHMGLCGLAIFPWVSHTNVLLTRVTYKSMGCFLTNLDTECLALQSLATLQ